jgi:diguanylate cyclase (GGDEF)-like protein
LNNLPPDIAEKLRACQTLPSPPTIAAEIITLVNEPEIDIKKFTALLACDPALSSKILRFANSPVYPYPKKIENLQQALMILGLNATISLALSFSLTKTLKTHKSRGLDYVLVWKRALLAGTVGRVLGFTCQMMEVEELYLSCLLQDLGMLALDQVFPELYAGNGFDSPNHEESVHHEQNTLGLDHAMVGAWLLTQWNFPDRFRLAVAGSHDPEQLARRNERTPFIYAVHLSGKIAEVFLCDTDPSTFQHLRTQAETRLGLKPEAFCEILETTKQHLPETARIFETAIPTWTDPQTILDNAREALLIRNLQTLKQVEEMQLGTVAMEAQYSHLEELNRHDSLTGALTRASLDKDLENSFEQALTHKECLTVVFADLDKFKSVNDTHGHQIGDAVLQAAARILASKTRATDNVGRYGGEEFVLILPNTSAEAAEFVCQRILEAFQMTAHELPQGRSLTVTISLGIATHTPDNPFSCVADLLQASDESVYVAKSKGGNQYVAYDKMKAIQTAPTTVQ